MKSARSYAQRKLQKAIAAAVDSYDHVTCADVAERASEQLGYEPSLPMVSRILNGWGWSKTKIAGKVAFGRPGTAAPLAIGDLVFVTVRRPGRVVDVDPPEGLGTDHVCVEIEGEIPPRWWIKTSQIEKGDQR